MTLLKRLYAKSIQATLRRNQLCKHLYKFLRKEPKMRLTSAPLAAQVDIAMSIL